MRWEIYRQAGAPSNRTSLDALNALLPSDAQTGSNWNAEKLAQVYQPDAIDRLMALKSAGDQFKS